jgi:hypothetical protein
LARKAQLAQEDVRGDSPDATERKHRFLEIA